MSRAEKRSGPDPIQPLPDGPFVIQFWLASVNATAAERR
jgi:hypothetical protein